MIAPGRSCDGEMGEWVGCVLRERLRLVRPLLMRHEAGGVPFAGVLSGEVAIRLDPAGTNPTGLPIESCDGDLRLRAVVPTSEVEFHARKPLLLHGVLALAPAAVLRWVRGSSGAVEVSYEGRGNDEAKLTLPSGTLSLPCADVSLGVATFEAVPIADPGETAMLPAGRDLAVAAAPDANSIGTLRLARSLRVDVVERRGNHARFVLRRPTDVIVAWVSVAALLPATPSLGIEAVEPIGPTASHAEWVFARSTVRCPRELPVATEQAGERQPVGSFRPGALVDLGDERGGWVEVLVHSGAVTLTSDTRLVAAKADLRDCEVRGPMHPRVE